MSTAQTARPKRMSATWYRLCDMGPDVGIVRYDGEDHDTFYRFAQELLNDLGVDVGPGERIRPPQVEWYRHNPCRDGEYAWMLGHAKGPGPGNWRGALVRVEPRPAADTTGGGW